MNKNNKNALLKSLLRAYWLRPETALWYTEMISLAKKFGVDNVQGIQSLDFGCMDGLNSFILLGGYIPEDFDAFAGMKESYSIQSKITLKDDYYDNVNLEDLAFNGRPPAKSFTYGVDWKKSHIERSRLLGAHQHLRLWDEANSLPIENSKMDLIWAPNIYWMNDLSKLLDNFYRITRIGGMLVTVVPDKKALKYSIMNNREGFEAPWLSLLDRGRYQNAIRSARSKDEWTTLFEEHGYSVMKCEGYISPKLISVYEIGFRPFFSPLLHMRRLLLEDSPDKFLDIKKCWIDALIDILNPLEEHDYFTPDPDDALWHMYKLIKK